MNASAERNCGWMSGPRDASVRVGAVKWWLAMSRGVIANDLRRHTVTMRPPASCHRTPAFVSPLARRG